MAGIGFELRRLMGRGTYSSLLAGFTYATIISAGPWLMSVCALAFLGVFSTTFLGFEQRQIFLSTVVYMYAGSLVGTGIIQIVVTRFLADKIYLGHKDALGQVFGPVLVTTLAIQFPVAVLVLWGAPLSPAFKITITSGYLVIGLIWQTMIFLSAVRDYMVVVVAFLLGAVISMAGGALWGRAYGLEGYMCGFIAGQAVLFFVLLTKTIYTFGLSWRWDWSFLRYVGRYPELVGIGFIYNLSVWIDKFLFGLLAEHGRIAADRFPTFNQYDSSMFLAFAAMFPAMAIFLTRTETSFIKVYQAYYDKTFFRRSLDSILESRREMSKVLADSFLDIIKLQGVVVFLLIYFADDLLKLVELPYSQTAIFRFGLIGAFLQVLMMFINVILLYLDLRKTVLGLTIWFLLANSVLSAITLELGFPFYGAGFAAACFLGLLAAVVMLYVQINNLEFITFAKRRIIGQTRARRRHRARHGGLYGRYRFEDLEVQATPPTKAVVVRTDR